MTRVRCRWREARRRKTRELIASSISGCGIDARRFIAYCLLLGGLTGACGSSSTIGRPSGCSSVLVHFGGTSMAPTIHDGDLLCSAHLQGRVDRGSIVIFAPPGHPSEVLVKRVIGLPGDSFLIDGSHVPPEVLIKQSGAASFQLLREPYLVTSAWTSLRFCCRADGTASLVASPITLPSDRFFVIGDNRDFSFDSRSFGLISRAEISGVVTSNRSNGNLGSPTLVPTAS